MSCFKLTKCQCKKITSALSSFWWNNRAGKNKIHWIAWDKLCKSKKDGGLGFRDIADFNKSLLAKQAWRLLSDKSSLLSGVYKARYYPKTPFLECGSGSRPSYAWRSIFFGRSLLEKGLVKSIGNGRDTSVWLDNWILDKLPRKPRCQIPIENLHMKVCELITEHGTWDNLKLQSLFLSSDIIRIQAFPPCLTLDDEWFWGFSTNGVYNVKSGYSLLSQTNQTPFVSSVSHSHVNKIKARLWKTKTLPKIKVFLWKAASGALAVADRLQSRGLTQNSLCSICRQSTETIAHALFECDAAVTVLRKLNYPALPLGIEHSIMNYLLQFLDLLDSPHRTKEFRDSLPWVLWHIWKQRNLHIFENKRSTAEFLIATASGEAEEWRLANLSSTHSPLQNLMPLNQQWLRPQVDFVKCNIASYWINNSSLVGVGWLVRNHNGTVLFHARDALLPCLDRIVADFECLKWALNSLLHLRIDKVEIETEQRAVINAVNHHKVWLRNRTYGQSILDLAHQFQSCNITLSSVTSNVAAKKLASSVILEGRWQSYIARGCPSWLSSSLTS